MLAPAIAIVFELDGEEKRLDFRKVPFSAWGELKRELGFTVASLIDALGAVDVTAYGALMWLERRQHDRSLKWATVQRELEQAETDTGFRFKRFLSGSELEEPDPPRAGS